MSVSGNWDSCGIDDLDFEAFYRAAIVSHVPFFSREAAFQGSMAVSAVQAQSVVCLSLRLRVRVSFTVGTTVLLSCTLSASWGQTALKTSLLMSERLEMKRQEGGCSPAVWFSFGMILQAYR
jgi:hypothetical protein